MQSILVISAFYMQFDEAMSKLSSLNHHEYMVGELFEFEITFSNSNAFISTTNIHIDSIMNI